jgi:hypothetical protein
VNFCFSLLIHDANIYFSGVQIDSAKVFVLLFIQSHSYASFHQLDYGLAVNRFYTDDVSEATGREFSVRQWAPKLLVGAREIPLPLTGNIFKLIGRP